MMKISCIGHLGKDCNVNSVNGKNVINFSVAHSEKFKNAQGVEVNKTTWVNCAYWIDSTKLAQYLTKGTQVYVEGQPDMHTYRARDGEWRSEMKCRVSFIQLLGNPNQRPAEQQNNNISATNQYTDIPQSGFDEVPF